MSLVSTNIEKSLCPLCMKSWNKMFERDTMRKKILSYDYEELEPSSKDESVP